jgi:hypothetical protein
MTLVAKVLLRALLITVTPRTAAALNNLLMELLEDLAEKTKTDLDDKLFALFKRFLATTDTPPKKLPPSEH